MKYVLILTVFNENSVHTHSILFETEAAALAAASGYRKTKDDAGKGQHYGVVSVTAPLRLASDEEAT